MTRLSIMTLRRFIRPVVGALTISLAFTFLFVLSRTTETVQASDDPVPEAVTATFAADPASLGAIPDTNATSPTCQNGATNQKDVTFTVTGLSGSITNVSVNFNASHTFIQDLEVTLIAPGGSPSHLLFSATGTTLTTANACGNGNNLLNTNTYTFEDAASANWWTTAASATNIPTSTNRTVVSGIGGIPSGVPAVTSMNTALAGATANGTWTLRFRDRGVGDTGTVTAANLTLTTGGTPGPTPQHVVDFNGDGKTDYAVIRNTGGGPTGQTTWFINNGTTSSGFAWGIANDFFVPEDYDGDGKTDIAVWRAGAPTQAAFYILQSTTNTLRLELFGQSGDDPTVVGDYDNDNKADIAVYREVTGGQSTWFYRGSNANPSGNTTFVPWGIAGDFPAPGDYDGDGRNDFVVQRGNVFWTRLATGTVSTVSFGLTGDAIAPGDYDGDGKTDITVVRNVGGAWNWFIRQSTTGNMVGGPFGLVASDFLTQGDYDGDGKTDIAVWRNSEGNFYVLNSGTGAASGVHWGVAGDYPAANYNSH